MIEFLKDRLYLSYLNVLYKRHELLHGTLDFWYLFHPVHGVSVVREVPSQLIVHFLQGGKSGVLPRRVRAGHVDDAMSGFLGRCCIFLWKYTGFILFMLSRFRYL